MRACLVPLGTPAYEALTAAISAAFDGAPVLPTREGGSGPEAGLQQAVGAPLVFLGVGLPDDQIHAPNEKVDAPDAVQGGRGGRAAVVRPRPARPGGAAGVIPPGRGAAPAASRLGALAPRRCHRARRLRLGGGRHRQPGAGRPRPSARVPSTGATPGGPSLSPPIATPTRTPSPSGSTAAGAITPCPHVRYPYANLAFDCITSGLARVTTRQGAGRCCSVRTVEPATHWVLRRGVPGTGGLGQRPVAGRDRRPHPDADGRRRVLPHRAEGRPPTATRT